MNYIEPREVTIRIPEFEMNGTIEGSLDSFKFTSTSSHFLHWFPSGEIDSLDVKEKDFNRIQSDIFEACGKKVKELFHIH